ncbi:GMC family oxidoreductase N-terminal domain-containing protein [Mumia sp.]|uniref:GMC family oxidoreductase N-terminal domain-containing protein n=1 Tax=Mumia sp. TaxID=1965300 RepID=UPI0026039863|nr:GMC family oxidoreductase N-terminal domain-containing protein [Mumia sp.]MDD9349836.1 GMC family oxidoreductase N-terminal domain-containing protein [Mumia sp.]
MRDVIVVGAGGGGPVVAAELAARGLDVLLLEGGSSHAQPEREWTHFENDAFNPKDGYFRVGPADRDRPAWIRDQPQNSYLWNVTGVGGTTLHYYGNSPRAYRGAFAGYDGADRDAYDTDHLFPFPYEELVPYYEWVEATLPVQTAPMGRKERVFFDGCEALGLPVQTTKDTHGIAFRPQENAILQPQGTAGRTSDSSLLVYPQAQGCTFCGFCAQGCRSPLKAPRNQFARRSTDNSYVPMAVTASAWAAAGRDAQLVTDAFVTQVHTEERGGRTVATGVTYRTDNDTETVREDAAVVVLAGGCVETPRLWLGSGLPNPNGWVGRGLTDHYLDSVVGTFDRDTGASRGPASAARAEFPGYGCLEQGGLPPALQAFSMSHSGSGIREMYDLGRGKRGAWDGVSGRLQGSELKDVMLNGIDRLLSVLVITADDVEPDNRVRLSPLYPRDEHGAPARVEMDFTRRSADTVRRRNFLANRAAEVLRAAGARKVYRIDWAPLILHTQSSMRMGADPATSVVGPTGEARAVERLFVADNSVLANSLGGPNPTLTTQAIGTRTAEQIFATYFDGDPWVGTEAPVPSTDPRISAAL